MTVDIPEFKRCCFCLPLRPGLLALGYFKIIADVLIIPALAYFMLCTIMLTYMSGGDKKFATLFTLYAAIALITCILIIMDVVATIVFIVGSHKKNVNLIEGFYNFCIGEFIVSILLILVAVGLSLTHRFLSNATQYLIYAAFFVTLVVQAYFILLLRSEVIKLKSQFRLLNNSAEAEEQCILMSRQYEAEIESD